MTGEVHAWASDLPSLHEQVWQRLVRGVGDRHARSRHPTLATVSTDGRPRARTVVLRGADPAARTLEIHTDLNSAKVAELRATPFAALHVWDAPAHLQTRIETEVTIMTGPAVARTWARLTDPTRASYGVVPPPGLPISGDLDYVRTADPKAFAVLQLHVLAIETLYLGSRHTRARFDRETDWQGQWLVP
jgi:hypothetical protein